MLTRQRGVCFVLWGCLVVPTLQKAPPRFFLCFGGAEARSVVWEINAEIIECFAK